MKNKKIFQSTISIPDNVIIKKEKKILFFSGPLGSTKMNLAKLDGTGMGAVFIKKNNTIFHKVEANNNLLKNSNENTLIFITHSKSFYGLFTNILKSKIYGVTRGFLIYLRILGIGYRAHIKNQIITFKLGYSHDIIFKIPDSIRVFLLEPTLICLYAIDKNQVTQVAAKMKQLRLPSAYKGKGIILSHEKLKFKQGKRK